MESKFKQKSDQDLDLKNNFISLFGIKLLTLNSSILLNRKTFRLLLVLHL